MSDHITDREYFSLSAAWAILAESAKKHDREAFHEAVHMLDMEPASLMRGMGYLTHKLAHVSEEEYPYMSPALSSLSGVMALCAVLVEHQNTSESYKLAEQMGGLNRGGKGPR